MQVHRRLLVLFSFILASIALSALPVSAQDSEQAVIGTLTVENEDGERVGVAGVVIAIEGGDSATSDESGMFRITVAEPGTYVVEIDVATLPEGINLRDAERFMVERVVEDGREATVLFALVSGEVEEDDGGGIDFRRIAQLTVEGLKQGLYLAMAAIGLSLIFGTTGLTNFAHAEMVTFGMLATYFFNFYGLAGLIGFLAPLPEPLGDGMNLIPAAILGMLAGAALGWALNRFIFRSAREAGVSLIAQMVMTIGLSIFLRYLLLYIYGGGPRTFGDFSAQRAWDLGPVDITPKDLTAMILSATILVGVGGYLQLTRMGKAMRAVADNRDLAESSGIDVQMVISRVWIAGGALAALSGVFFGLDQVKWDFGFRILLLIFAAVVLGGLGTAYGALVGAIVVGLTINLSTLVFDPEIKNMWALLVMVFILLVRPQGILGKPERVG